jgi:excisionase family DNA binding protein
MKTKRKPAPPPALPAGVEALLDARDVRAALKIGESTFEDMIREGRFPAADLRIGRLNRWRAATVNAWIARATEAV